MRQQWWDSVRKLGGRELLFFYFFYPKRLHVLTKEKKKKTLPKITPETSRRKTRLQGKVVWGNLNIWFQHLLIWDMCERSYRVSHTFMGSD